MKHLRSVSGKEIDVSPKYAERESEGDPEIQAYCKACGEKGLTVLPVTVASHVSAQHWNLLADGFRFSQAANCPVIYFNNYTGTYFLKDEAKTRFGPKESGSPRPICYCLGVTEEDIRYEVLKKGCCDSLLDIEQYTKAGTGKWCLTTNPSGKCCRDYLPAIVDKYLGMKVRRNVKKDLLDVKKHLEQPNVMLRKVEMIVGKMTCQSCASGVKSILENMGGENVSVRYPEGHADLMAPAGIMPEELARAVEQSGYTARVTVTGPPEKRTETKSQG